MGCICTAFSPAFLYPLFIPSPIQYRRSAERWQTHFGAYVLVLLSNLQHNYYCVIYYDTKYMQNIRVSDAHLFIAHWKRLSLHVNYSYRHILTYHHIYHSISYHIVDLKRQNRLKVGTNKPKLKVKMQSLSDDDVRKRLLEQARFELMTR